jgi:ankyrin repeat protein
VGGFTVLHFAAHANHIGILQKLWVYAEECKLNPKELKTKMLLAKNKRGCTTWHVAALNGKLEACETLRNFAKETEIYLDVRLLAQTEEVFTAPHIAAQRNNVDILQKEWELFVAMPVNPTA